VSSADQKAALDWQVARLTIWATAQQGRELVVVDSTEVDYDLVRDMTEILTPMCARLNGKRAAQPSVGALAAAAIDDTVVAP
jgi:predicted site-specific integrase-resolvase